MPKHIILAKRPDIVLRLEKYGLLPDCKSGGKYEGCAKQWASDGAPPYDTPQAQALAERLPAGWEELTENEFDQLLEKLNAVLEEKKKNKLETPNRGSERMLKNLVKIVFIAITAAAGYIETEGIGMLPDQDTVDKQLANQLSLELLLHLMIGAELFQTVFREIAAATGAASKDQEMIANILRLAAFFLMILAASRGKETRLKALLNSFKETLLEGLMQAEQFISESILNKNIEGEKTEEAALLLQQAKLALKQDDFEGIYETYQNALRIVDLTPESIVSDIDAVHSFASKLHLAMTSGASRETASMTTVSQAM